MKHIIHKIRVLMTRQDKFELLGIVLISALSALWEVAGIGLMIPVVAAVVNPELLEQNVYLKMFYNFSPFKEPRAFMVYTALLTIGNFALKNIFSYWVLSRQSSFIFRKQRELSLRLFNNFLRADYAYTASFSPAELSARIHRVSLACEGTLLPMMLLLSDFLAVAAMTLALLWFMPLALVGALTAMLVLAVLLYWPIRALNSRISSEYIRTDNAVTQDKITVFSGIKTVKSCNCEDYFSRRYAENIGGFVNVFSKMYLFGQLPRLALEVLAVALAMAIFCAMVLLKVPTGTIILQFALLVAAIGRILPALSRMHYNLTRIRQVRSIFNGLFEDLTLIEPEVRALNAEGSDIKRSLQNVLEIKDLSFAYPDGKKIFENFSLSIKAHSSVALIGPTGGGKTTLAELVIGLLKADGGCITFDGVDLHSDLYGFRRIIGYVPQYVFLYDGSIRQNVALGSDEKQIDDEKLSRVLRMANLENWVASLPQGVETMVGENGMKLSGGQRQRLGIARALYREPELLILDEATSALDNESESCVVEALEKLHGKLTMLVIAHRLSTIEHCDQVITIGSGDN